MNKEHYVYLYIDPRNGDVFYVGCGKAYRMMFHLRPSMRKKSTPKNRIINEIMALGIHPMIVAIVSGLTQNEALQIERETIAYYGKENLTNLTTGGQGCPGNKSFLGRHHTDETKEKMRQSKIGAKNPMFGKKRSTEVLAKFSAKMKGESHPNWGKPRDQETRSKISETLKNKPMSEGEREVRRKRLDAVRRKMKEEGRSVTRHRQMITCGGEILSIDGWSARTGIKKPTIRARIDRGWEIEQALGMEER